MVTLVYIFLVIVILFLAVVVPELVTAPEGCEDMEKGFRTCKYCESKINCEKNMR
jgi:hypothetical protein